MYLLCVCNILEQLVEEQVSECGVPAETSNFDTTILESTDQAFESKDSVVLSLVDHSKEHLIEKSLPESPSFTVDVDEQERSTEDPGTFTVSIHG